MKIYEKPMAIVERINCEDVMTTSPVVSDENTASAAYSALKTAAQTDNAIIFEW